MNYKQIKTHQLVNKITREDTLFKGKYTIDPYQFCEFDCKYCDSSTNQTIIVKRNAAEVFEKEIKNLQKGTIIVGSVHDPYQKAEKTYKITKNLLKIIYEYDFPCHILTKSEHVLRDIDLLKKIKDCRVTISVISLEKNISEIFEKNIPTPNNRLNIVKKLSENHIKSGVAVIPSLPFIVEDEIPNIVNSAKKHGADSILHKPLELKGDQKTLFLDVLDEYFPNLVEKYQKLYHNSITPNSSYTARLNMQFENVCKKYGLKNSI